MPRQPPRRMVGLFVKETFAVRHDGNQTLWDGEESEVLATLKGGYQLRSTGDGFLDLRRRS